MPSFCSSCGSDTSAGACARCATLPGSQPRLPEAGQTFAGRYRIGEVLGRGGMGVVYRARDLILKEDVALKIIRPELLNRPQVLTRFLREATLARKLAHPNICRIHDLGETDGLRYLSMQLVEGESLEHVLRARGPLPADEVRHLTDRLLLALASAHERGIVHRDIKPKNIVIDPHGDPVLMDFGIAKDLNPSGAGEVSTLAGVSVGTPSYMSPEIAQGGTASPASDIYSLGITVYKLITGKLPFEGESTFAILRKQVEQEAPAVEASRPDVPADLVAFIRGALEKDLSLRFRTASGARQVLLRRGPEELAPVTSSKDAPVAGEETTLFSVRGAGSRAWLSRAAAAAAVVLLALTVLMGYRLVQGKPDPAPAGVVAVLPFVEAPGLGSFGGTGALVADMLTTRLGRGPSLAVISRLKLEQIARESGGGAPTLDAVRRAGALRLVSGSIALGGGRLRIDAQLTDAASGTVLRSVRREASEGTALFDLVDPLAEDLADALGATLSSATLVGLTTSSLDAYRAYDRGLSAFGRLDLVVAREELERAVAVDPAFALAWSRLATVCELLGRRERAGSAARRALELSDRLAGSERELVRGTARLIERRWDSALGHFNRYLADHPDDARALEAAGKCQLGRRAWDSASELFERAIASDPGLGVSWDRLGAAWLARHDYDQAVERFTEIKRRAPRSPWPDVGLGRVELERHRPIQAAEAFSAALAIDPSSVAARVGLGDAAFARRDVAAANIHYSEARASSPEAAAPVVGLARVALAMRRDDEARKRFEELLARDPQDPDGLEGIGRIAQNRHAYDEARAWYEKAAEVDPYLVDPRLTLARLALAERRFDDALATIALAEKLDPYDLRAVLLRGQIHRQQRRFDLARAAAEEVRRRDPFEPEAFNLLGLVADDLHDFELASQWYEKAVKLDPGHTFAMNNLGVARARAGEQDLAIRWLERAATNDPFEPVTFANLGLVAALRGDSEAAARWFKRARDLDPANVQVWLAESGAARAQGDAPAALAALEQALVLNPREERVLCERGRALAELGRNAEARRSFERALEVNPRFLEAALGLVSVDLEGGAAEAALARLEATIGAGDAVGAVRAGRRLLEGGRDAEGRAWIARALGADPGNAWVAYDAAQALAERGERTESLRMLGIAADRGFSDVRVLLADRAFESLRGDPGFVALTGRLGAVR